MHCGWVSATQFNTIQYLVVCTSVTPDVSASYVLYFRSLLISKRVHVLLCSSFPGSIDDYLPLITAVPHLIRFSGGLTAQYFEQLLFDYCKRKLSHDSNHGTNDKNTDESLKSLLGMVIANQQFLTITDNHLSFLQQHSINVPWTAVTHLDLHRINFADIDMSSSVLKPLPNLTSLRLQQCRGEKSVNFAQFISSVADTLLTLNVFEIYKITTAVLPIMPHLQCFICSNAKTIGDVHAIAPNLTLFSDAQVIVKAGHIDDGK